MNIKKFLISQLMKIKVAHSMPGRIRFKVSSLTMIPEEYRKYEKFIGESIGRLNGITKVDVNNITGSVLVTYDTNLLYEKKILKWVDKIKEIGIGNYELIEKYGESNVDFVIKTIEQQLDEAVKKLW